MDKVLTSGVGDGKVYQVQKESFKFDKNQIDSENKINRVWGYLHNQRGISSQTIDQLHRDKVLAQDKLGNALFCGLILKIDDKLKEYQNKVQKLIIKNMVEEEPSK